MDKELLLKSKNRIDRPPFAFWGFLFSATTLAFGLYIFFNQGHISVIFINPHLDFLTETIIAVFAIISGGTKLLGVFTNKGWLKQGGIILMSGYWTGLATLATMYALGVGYPSPNFIIYWAITIGCYRISRKGDFLLTWENLTAIIVSLVAAGGMVYSAWSTHRGKKADIDSQKDAEKIESDFRLIEEMRKELVRLYARMAEKDVENQRLEAIIDTLEAEADKHQDELKDALERNRMLNEEKKQLLNRITELELKLKEIEGGEK